MGMILTDQLASLNTIFFDTAPVIYYIEAHPDYGPLMKKVIARFHAGRRIIFTSVITITEVLPKPVSLDNEELVKRFMEFLSKGRNIDLLEISPNIAEQAGRLRGKYKSLRTMDAIQLAAAIDTEAPPIKLPPL
ncbi:MAG: type II toxin-antitoxin system VapC family toxin [bacterium]|nr:type II toxin-antitoxin system VapC family toxin [bacterium]